MRYLRILLLVALATILIDAIAVGVANAEALPSILWLTTGEMSVAGAIGNGAEVVAQLNSVPVKVTAKKISLRLTGAAGGMADLGSARITLEGSELSGHKCYVEGDSLENAVVLVGGEWHIVLDLSGRYMILVLVPEITIKCDGSVTFKLRGSELVLGLNGGMPLESGKEYGSFALDWECEAAGSRKAKWKEYSNHEGRAALAKLEINAGLGWEEACEEVKGEFALSAEPSIEFMEP